MPAQNKAPLIVGFYFAQGFSKCYNSTIATNRRNRMKETALDLLLATAIAVGIAYLLMQWWTT